MFASAISFDDCVRVMDLCLDLYLEDWVCLLHYCLCHSVSGCVIQCAKLIPAVMAPQMILTPSPGHETRPACRHAIGKS